MVADDGLRLGSRHALGVAGCETANCLSRLKQRSTTLPAPVDVPCRMRVVGPGGPLALRRASVAAFGETEGDAPGRRRRRVEVRVGLVRDHPSRPATCLPPPAGARFTWVHKRKHSGCQPLEPGVTRSTSQPAASTARWILLGSPPGPAEPFALDGKGLHQSVWHPFSRAPAARCAPEPTGVDREDATRLPPASSFHDDILDEVGQVDRRQRRCRSWRLLGRLQLGSGAPARCCAGKRGCQTDWVEAPSRRGRRLGVPGGLTASSTRRGRPLCRCRSRDPGPSGDNPELCVVGP